MKISANVTCRMEAMHLDELYKAKSGDTSKVVMLHDCLEVILLSQYNVVREHDACLVKWLATIHGVMHVRITTSNVRAYKGSACCFFDGAPPGLSKIIRRLRAVVCVTHHVDDALFRKEVKKMVPLMVRRETA